MLKPLVSIVTPSFNQASWLEQTIQSVLNQTYDNIEYIIIDGGSTDGSKEIIEKYAAHLKYWQSKPDGGQADAINIGFKMAKGQLLAYLNADDLYEPTAVETMVNTYEVNQEFAIYYGRCKTIDEKGNLLKEGQGSQLKFESLAKDGMLPHIYQPACFFNSSYFTRNYFVDTQYKFAFDYELILHLSLSKSILFLNRDVASYRVHDASKTSLNQVEAYKEKLSIQEKYNKGDFFLHKWKRFKLAVAQKSGKIQ